MSSTILGGDFTVNYLDENRQASIEWSGTNDNDTHTANAVYSALMDLFDEAGQSDDAVPMSAQTPTEYTVGIVDAGSLDPWYITYDAMEHITGGAVRTASWARVTTSNVGIIVVKVTSNTMTATDIGATVDNATDTGTLLEIIDNGTDVWFVIRPTDFSTTHDWDTASGTINSTLSAGTATQDAVALTGEQIWANEFSLGTIEDDTHIFGYYGLAETDTGAGPGIARVRITSVNSTTEDWWGDGQIDMCVPIRDWTTAAAPVIDSGFVTFKAHKYTAEYSFFEVQNSVTSGGRNPVPLGSKNDLNNSTGFSSITYTNASTTGGHWNVGDEILGGTSGARAIITQIDSPGATQTVHYYLLGQQPSTTDHFGGALTDFQTAAETCANQDAGGTGSKDGNPPTAQGPSVASWFTNTTLPTISFTSTLADIDNDGTDENYAVEINCQSNPLTEVYEWLKYFTRYGATGTAADGIPGELYVGGEVYLFYGTDVPTGTFGEGDDVIQETTGATGVVMSHDVGNNIVMLRSVRGTFATGSATDHTVTTQDVAGAFEMETADGALAVSFAANAVSPFGSFAGGTFFGARGVTITGWVAADENKFFLTPVEGGTKSRPQSISITISNLYGTAITDATADLAAAFRLTTAGGVIDKTEYTATGASALGAATLVTDAITADTPGATTGGTLVIRDTSDTNKSYYIRYDSWATATFTLSSFASFVTTATSTTTQITYATGGFSGAVERGDLVYDVTQGTGNVSYVASVDSDTQLTIDPPLTGFVQGNNIAINVVPIDDAADDSVYVPLIHVYPTSTTASVSVEYLSTLDFRVAVRNNRVALSTDGPIVPFTTDDQAASSTDNRSIATIRTIDTITT